MYRGGGHGSSAPASSSEVGKGRLGLGTSAFREESLQGLGWSQGRVDGVVHGAPAEAGHGGGGSGFWAREKGRAGLL
jgi:hypothetical protein